MILAAFLNWALTARSADRVKAASALAKAYTQNELDVEQRAAALSAMAHLINDPSAAVRRALANELARSIDAPRHIVMALAHDQPDVAAELLIYSPCLSDDDLIEIAAVGTLEAQALLSSRADLSKGLVAALCEIAEPEVLALLLERGDIAFTSAALSSLARNFAADYGIRNQLLQRSDLPLASRQSLLLALTGDLVSDEFLGACLGEGRLAYVVAEAERHAQLKLMEAADANSLGPLVSAWIAQGKLTVESLVCLSVLGLGDALCEVLAQLSGAGRSKIAKALSSGRLPVLGALFKSAGIPPVAADLLSEVTLYWRSASEYDPIGGLVAHLKDRLLGRSNASDYMAFISMIDHLLRTRRLEYVEQDVLRIRSHAA